MKLTETQSKWVEETLSRMAKKMEKVRERSAEKIPYDTKDGIHADKSDERNISWWTNGFWGGMMWQMFTLTGQERYKEIAQWNEEKLDTCFLHFDMLDHDNGFKWLPTAVADYRVTGNERSKKARTAGGGDTGRTLQPCREIYSRLERLGRPQGG